MDLQGADAGGEVDDAWDVLRGQSVAQGLDAQAEFEIQGHFAEFYEQVFIAGAADGDVAMSGEDGGFGVGAVEADAVAGFELAHFPEVRLGDDGGADEAAEGRAVGA